MGFMSDRERKEKSIEEIRSDVLACKRCPLYQTRNLPVIGQGSLDAKIMFCGEAPGYWEDQKGLPFSGAAGRVLDELLHSAGIKREEVYISNLLKCRPPQNRDPRPEEISACFPYLERQIEIIKPKVISPLGRYSMKYILEKYGFKDQIESISKIHGRVFQSHNLFENIIIIPLYHPAVVTYNANMRETLIADFKVLASLV